MEQVRPRRAGERTVEHGRLGVDVAQLSHRGTTGMTDPRREQQLGSLVPGCTGEPARATSGGDRVRWVEVDLAEPFAVGGPGAVRRWRSDGEQPVA